MIKDTFHRITFEQRTTGYKAAQIIMSIQGKLTKVIFSTDQDNAYVEIYRGPNYIVDAIEPNWSRSYKNSAINRVPEHYRHIVTRLVDEHNNHEWK